jgi:hypothetical protein
MTPIQLFKSLTHSECLEILEAARIALGTTIPGNRISNEVREAMDLSDEYASSLGQKLLQVLDN